MEASVTDTVEGFTRIFGSVPSHRIVAPGRINLIGEHIDYCGGQVMPMAIDQHTTGLFRLNDKSVVRIYSDRFDEMATVIPHDVLTKKAGIWNDYAQGLLRESAHRSPDKGFDLLVRSTLGSGGLSSSSSFLAMLALANHFALAGEMIDPADRGLRLQLALNCQRAENSFVGIPSGIMDPAAILLGGLIKLDCNTLKYTRLTPLPKAYCIVILDTGTPRTLVGSGYAKRVQEVRAIEALLGRELLGNGLANLDPQLLSKAKGKLPDPILKARLEHLVTEQQRVIQAADCLSVGNMSDLGTLMNASHYSLQSDYQVSSKELDAITTLSRHHSATAGSRMTGAGFGGCAISLCRRDQVTEHNRCISEDYFNETGHTAGLYTTDTAGPARIEAL